MTISLNQIIELIRKHNGVLLDIRTKEEYCQGHLPGAILMETQLPPITQIQKEKLQNKLKAFVDTFKIHKQRPIIVYCKKGKRAEEAKKILHKLGHNNVYNIGGIETSPLKDYIQKIGVKC